MPGAEDLDELTVFQKCLLWRICNPLKVNVKNTNIKAVDTYVLQQRVYMHVMLSSLHLLQFPGYF